MLQPVRTSAFGRNKNRSERFGFIGSKRGGLSAATALTLIEAPKLHGIDPQGWLTSVLGASPIAKSHRSMKRCFRMSVRAERI